MTGRPLLSVAALSIGFIVGLAWWLGLGQGLASEASPTSPSPPSPAEVAAQTLERISTAPEEIVLASTLDAVGGQLDILPEGAEVEPRADTFESQGEVGEMLVDVRLPDGSVDTFLAVMVNVDGDWYLAYTVRGDP